jgi:DNA-binding NtrC family response regulator
MFRLLLCTYDAGLRAPVASALDADFVLSVDSNRERVKDLCARRGCDIVVLDIEGRTDAAPFQFFDELRALDVPVVMVTGGGERQTTMEMVRRGIHHYCRKPLVPAELRIVLRWAVDHALAKREIVEQHRGYPAEDLMHSAPFSQGSGRLVGSSKESELVTDLIRRVANLDAYVLITGESGTGKELIARTIHSTSHRAKNPFLAVSCGAVPETLIEAELFGHEKGAFTGASSRRTGYFEEAAGGTLLLDEIGDISHHTQIKLLRVLQEREFTRLGGTAPVPFTARVVFATNRNLKQMVAEGSFREDLYYRLNVVSIRSRPLRERRADVYELATHFLTKYAAKYQKRVTRIDPEAIALLREYSWPGNIRELECAIQNAIILSDDDTIQVSNLPAEIQELDLKEPVDAQLTSFEDQLHEYKVKLAVAAVRDSNGNKTLAAQSLNISRTYLHRLLRDNGDEAPALRIA